MHTLSRQHSYAEEIKKSRFIATGLPVGSPEEALEKLAEVSDSQATHNCWAYKVGDEYRFSDDGEPGGTAGRPILAAIEGRVLDRVLVVVTRFFGGTKLGAGGLVRAYGGTAAKCLNAAKKTEIIRRIEVLVTAPFNDTGAIYPLFAEHGVEKTEERFTEDGIHLTVTLDERSYEPFERAIIAATRGRAEIVSRGH